MKTTMFKIILAGTLFGAFIFFTGPLLLIVLLLKFIFTPFGMHRTRPMHYAFAGQGNRAAFADKLRAMSDEEYQQFKTSRFNKGCHYQQENQ